MSIGQRAYFWLIELPAYGLAALAAFMVGAMLVHWSVGLILGGGVVLGMRAMGPAFKRLVRSGETSQ